MTFPLEFYEHDETRWSRRMSPNSSPRCADDGGGGPLEYIDDAGTVVSGYGYALTPLSFNRAFAFDFPHRRKRGA